MTGRFVRLGEFERPKVEMKLDGEAISALAGDTVLTAILAQSGALGSRAFEQKSRGGFCLMGACQDCRVWTSRGERLRACTTAVAEGMDVHTERPEGTWPTLG